MQSGGDVRCDDVSALVEQSQCRVDVAGCGGVDFRHVVSSCAVPIGPSPIMLPILTKSGNRIIVAIA